MTFQEKRFHICGGNLLFLRDFLVSDYLAEK